jgi:hypothetical protein
VIQQPKARGNVDHPNVSKALQRIPFARKATQIALTALLDYLTFKIKQIEENE